MLVQWSCILLARLQLPTAQKAAARILAAQAGPLEALRARGHLAAATARRTARLLRRRPDLVPEYLAAAKATGAASLAYHSLVVSKMAAGREAHCHSEWMPFSRQAQNVFLFVWPSFPSSHKQSLSTSACADDF